MWWHGDYRRDQLGRTVDEIKRDIEQQEKRLEIRRSYNSSREGYGIRSEEMARNIELDRRMLAETLEAIKQHRKGRR